MSTTETLELNTEIRADDYADSALFLASSGKFFLPASGKSNFKFCNKYTPLSVILVSIIGYFFLTTPWWPGNPDLTMIVVIRDSPEILIAFAFIIPIYFAWNYVTDRRNIYRMRFKWLLRNRKPQAVRFKFDADGVALSRESVESKIEWRAFESWVDRADRHLLRYGDLEVLIIPKTGLNTNQTTALAELIGKHVKHAVP